MPAASPGKRVRISGNVFVQGGNLDTSEALTVDEVAISASPAELNKLASVTAGTVAASKAVVVDANKVALGLRVPLVVVTADTTLTEADSGKVVVVNAAASKVLTLPATAAGLTFTLVHAVASTSGAGHSISPVAADLVRGNGITPADNKDLICTQATSRIGDSVTLVGDGVDGWYITAITGTWAREG